MQNKHYLRRILLWILLFLLFPFTSFSYTISTTLKGSVWMNFHWYHRLVISIPKNLIIKNYVFLYITGSESTERPLRYLNPIAESLGMPVSTIYDIPNQPLFDGLREDALVAYTFEKFIKTGNKDWIIFFPMVHSIKKAMDYLSSYFSHYLGVKIEGFILSGASKRGWVTYLVAQDDTRVKGIIPLSFDNVNFRKTIPHQLEQWGKYSPDLFDYEKNGILDMLNTPIGKKLLSYVDPWYMRKKIKIPKLIIVGTNDNYWTIDAASFYFDKLWGPEYIYYMPNRGHSLGWDAKVFFSIKRFILSVVKKYRLPSFKMTYTYSKEEDKVYFRIKSTKVRPSGASIWYATSYTRDFRKAVFREKPLFFSKSQKEFFGWLWLPEMRFMAFYPELKYSKGNSSFYLCAPANILKGQLAHPEMVPKKD